MCAVVASLCSALSGWSAAFAGFGSVLALVRSGLSRASVSTGVTSQRTRLLMSLIRPASGFLRSTPCCPVGLQTPTWSSLVYGLRVNVTESLPKELRSLSPYVPTGQEDGSSLAKTQAEGEGPRPGRNASHLASQKPWQFLLTVNLS